MLVSTGTTLKFVYLKGPYWSDELMDIIIYIARTVSSAGVTFGSGLVTANTSIDQK